ncbi:EamA family transporter [Candidatus Woesearchaeota archaeon]|nr:EamA family transporter [Candidatus Woesearchaeota archaeon]
MEGKKFAMLLMLLTTVLTSAAQLLYKAGSASLSFDILSILANIPLLAGLALYALGAVLMIKAFKAGEVTVLYPIVATSYIWVSLFSIPLFGEKISSLQWSGILAVVIGVVIISRSSNGKAQAEVIA